MKRIFSLLLITAITITISGCSGGSIDGTSTTPLTSSGLADETEAPSSTGVTEEVTETSSSETVTEASTPDTEAEVSEVSESTATESETSESVTVTTTSATTATTTAPKPAEPDKPGEYVYRLGGGGIEKVKADGSSKSVLIKDANITSIVGTDNVYVYYTATVKDKSGAYHFYLYRIKTNGTDKFQFPGEGYTQDYIDLYDGWIYYTPQWGYGISRIKTDGTNKTELVPGWLGETVPNMVGQTIYKGDWIYFIGNQFNVYRIKRDGTNETTLVTTSESEKVTWLAVDDNGIYYKLFNWDEYANYLYRSNLDGSNQSKLVDEHVGVYIVNNGWVYYINIDEFEIVSAQKYDEATQGNAYCTNIGDPTAWVREEYKRGNRTLTRWISPVDGSEWEGVNTNSPIYKIKTDGTGRTQLGNGITAATNSMPVDFKISGGWLYFTKNAPYVSGKFPDVVNYKVKLDGTGLTKA